MRVSVAEMWKGCVVDVGEERGQSENKAKEKKKVAELASTGRFSSDATQAERCFYLVTIVSQAPLRFATVDLNLGANGFRSHSVVQCESLL